jgi:hypothetical protein
MQQAMNWANVVCSVDSADDEAWKEVLELKNKAKGLQTEIAAVKGKKRHIWLDRSRC